MDLREKLAMYKMSQNTKSALGISLPDEPSAPALSELLSINLIPFDASSIDLIPVNCININPMPANVVSENSIHTDPISGNSSYSKPKSGNSIDTYPKSKSGNLTFASSDSDPCAIYTKSYSPEHIHGNCSLSEALHIDLGLLSVLFDGVCTGQSIDEYLFFDIETTGLSGGAGTVAFLAGCGYFNKHTKSFTNEKFESLACGFTVRQFFMRDYNEEKAFLNQFNNLLASFKGLITFNGKAFDWNIIQGRFAFHKIKPAVPNPVIIDLLYPSRRLWKRKYASCRLSSIEENILNAAREDDMPGFMIPALYFRYLQYRDEEFVNKVLLHNELDILTMVALLIRISKLVSNPLDETICPYELYGLGGIFGRSGDFENMAVCLDECIRIAEDGILYEALKQLAKASKQKGDYEKAICCWHRLIQREEMKAGITQPTLQAERYSMIKDVLYPYIEMAIYHEHRIKDPALAASYTKRAIELCHRLKAMQSEHCIRLQIRISRLEDKLKKIKL